MQAGCATLGNTTHWTDGTSLATKGDAGGKLHAIIRSATILTELREHKTVKLQRCDADTSAPHQHTHTGTQRRRTPLRTLCPHRNSSRAPLCPCRPFHYALHVPHLPPQSPYTPTIAYAPTWPSSRPGALGAKRLQNVTIVPTSRGAIHLSPCTRSRSESSSGFSGVGIITDGTESPACSKVRVPRQVVAQCCCGRIATLLLNINRHVCILQGHISIPATYEVKRFARLDALIRAVTRAALSGGGGEQMRRRVPVVTWAPAYGYCTRRYISTP